MALSTLTHQDWFCEHGGVRVEGCVTVGLLKKLTIRQEAGDAMRFSACQEGYLAPRATAGRVFQQPHCLRFSCVKPKGAAA